MKKNNTYVLTLFLYFLAILIPNLTKGINAYPYPIEFSQPDGSKISILLKGDEKIRWAETSDGYAILYNKTGTYEYAVLDSKNNMIPSGIQARNQKNRSKTDNIFLNNLPKYLHYSSEQIQMMKSAWSVYQSESENAFPTTGSHNLICILIGFTDKAFTKTQTDFNDLFNQINYTTGGATGSVKDYYLENSYNQFNLTVTVAGPYTASNNQAYYGANTGSGGTDIRPRELVAEAINLANPDVNFANFDNDNNGSVDGVYVIYAGYGEEAGGGTNCIWAHAWGLATPLTLDGKIISRYSCSPELSGNSGSNITNIGVICHEFGHVLGAYDFYDIDYSTGGQYTGTGNWDLMASGSWNNNGKTPAHHNAYTKTITYNWASPTTLNSGTMITLDNAVENSNSFYRYNTNTSNEYFLIENRQQLKFDTYIPGHGMIIYHVDGNYISTVNGINAGSHQGMYPVCADATGNPTTTYGIINGTGCPFPGTGSKTSFTDLTTPNSKSWVGANTAKPLTNVTENNINKTVSFAFMGGVSCTSPSVQASSFTSSSITHSSMTIGWVRGDGNSVLVLARQGGTVDESPSNSISYTANIDFGSGSQIGFGNYVVYNGTGTSVNISNLTQGNTYYFAVYEYNASDHCYKTPALNGNACTTGYCAAGSLTTYSFGEYISNVTIGTINQASGRGSSGYQDFTSPLSTDLTIGTTASATINCTYFYDYDHVLIWIDWNQNDDFTDPGENVYVSSVYPFVNPHITADFIVPISAVIGTTRMRIRLDDAANGPNATPCGFGEWGEVEDYTINVLPPTNSSFTAAINHDWNTNGNWDNGVPASTTNAIIPSGKLAELNSNNMQCTNLTIAPSADLSILSSGNLKVNGNLNMQSDLNGTASLLELGTLSVTGTTTAERYIPKDNTWHLLSSPVSNQAIKPEFAPSSPDVSFDFYKWDESIPSTGNVWQNIRDNSGAYVSGFTTFENGRGYLVAYSSSYTGTSIHYFNGELNNGDQSIAVSNSSNTYNLIGNPFPSAIDWDATGYNNRTSCLENTSPSIWIWNGIYGNYGVYAYGAGTNDITGIIPPHQGFFVKAIASSSFTIPNSARVHPTQNFTKTISTDLLRLKVKARANSYGDEILIKKNKQTNEGEGVEKWFSMLADAPALYSVKNNKKYSINTLTEITDQLIVPVGFVTGINSNYTISAEGIQSFGYVLLEDLQTGVQQNLSIKNSYSFTAQQNDPENRFLIYFNSNDRTDEMPIIYYNLKSITIINPWIGKTTLSIYNIKGQIIRSFTIETGNNNFNFKTTQGVYVFKMTNDAHVFVKKEVIY
ncbi:MAG: M6 family metalloprotease domain-containing protein [Bacteroidales bacterium]